MTETQARAHLVLADGTSFSGRHIGATGNVTGEAVFTTGMTGYQEVLSDPSYCNQIVTMTAPQIGNTGANVADMEAAKTALSGFAVHELAEVPSNWRSEQSLDAFLKAQGVVGITGIDTRAVTRKIRDDGAQMAAIGTDDPDTLRDRASAAAPMTGLDLTQRVTTDASYEWTDTSHALDGHLKAGEARGHGLHVVTIDFGVKLNILRCLRDLGCKVTVLPAATTADDLMAFSPDGIFLSNGPGDPAAVTEAIKTVKELLGKKPIFGICLGHQILSLALGGSSFKLKFGHHGLNQPVKDLATGKIEVTSQNHGFCVDVESLKGHCEMTHVHLNDDTCEGIHHPETGAFSVQYHPEASAGPHDSRYLFDRFIEGILRTK